MPAGKPLPHAYEPIVTGYRRISGGNMQVTWSVAPGKLVRKTVPAGEFNPATIAILTEQLKGEHEPA